MRNSPCLTIKNRQASQTNYLCVAAISVEGIKSPPIKTSRRLPCACVRACARACVCHWVWPGV